jgi:hypothetical protein
VLVTGGVYRMNVVSLREYVFVIIGSVVISLAVLFRWVRHPRTLVTIALTISIGIVLWNTLLNVTNATSLNVDSPFLGLSVQDVGSGVGAFLVTVLVLRLAIHKTEPVPRVVWASAVVGVVTVLVDLVG